MIKKCKNLDTLAKGLARINTYLPDQEVFYQKVASKLRRQLISLKSENLRNEISDYMANLDYLFEEIIACEPVDSRSIEYRRESACVIREFKASTKFHPVFLETVKKERAPEDYDALRQIGFNVTIFPQLNDQSQVDFKEAYEQLKPSKLIMGARREFTRIYQLWVVR